MNNLPVADLIRLAMSKDGEGNIEPIPGRTWEQCVEVMPEFKQVWLWYYVKKEVRKGLKTMHTVRITITMTMEEVECTQ